MNVTTKERAEPTAVYSFIDTLCARIESKRTGEMISTPFQYSVLYVQFLERGYITVQVSDRCVLIDVTLHYKTRVSHVRDAILEHFKAVQNIEIVLDRGS